MTQPEFDPETRSYCFICRNDASGMLLTGMAWWLFAGNEYPEYGTRHEHTPVAGQSQAGIFCAALPRLTARYPISRSPRSIR